jgi:hypothetical protein
MRQIELTAEGITIRLTVRHATVADVMRRGILAGRALDTEYRCEAEQAVAVMVYPRCLGCVEGVIEINGEVKDIQSLTPREFADLPYEIGEAWLAAVIEENPGWALQMSEEQDAEKKD